MSFHNKKIRTYKKKNYLINFKPDSKRNHDLSLPPKKEYIRTVMIMDTNSNRKFKNNNNIILYILYFITLFFKLLKKIKKYFI